MYSSKISFDLLSFKYFFKSLRVFNDSGGSCGGVGFTIGTLTPFIVYN